MDVKNTIWIDNYSVVVDDTSMTYQDIVDRAEEIAMKEIRSAMAGPLLVPLYFFFDRGKRPISAIEFWDFWESLDLFERLPFLHFSENVLLPAKVK